MSVIVEAGSFTSRSGTGTQTVSLDSGRWGSVAPKAVILWTHWSGTADSDLTYGILCFGMMTADDQVANHLLDADGQATTISNRIHDQDAVLTYIDQSDVLFQEAVYDSFGAAEFTIDWLSNTLSSGRQIGYYAIGGSDVSVSLDHFNSPTTASEVSYTGPGFEPVWLCGTTVSHGVTSTLAAHNIFTLGVADGTTQGSSSFFSQDALGTTKTGRMQRADFLATVWNDATREIGNLTSLDATGYTIDWTTAITTAVRYSVLAVKGPQIKVIKGLQPATNTTVNRDAGFVPIGAFWNGIGYLADTNPQASSKIQLGAWDDDDNQIAVGFFGQDNVSTSDTARRFYSNRGFASFNQGSNTGEMTASASGNNVVETWTLVDTNQREHYISIFGDAVASDSSFPLHGLESRFGVNAGLIGRCEA